jgi:hypothetical protein
MDPLSFTASLVALVGAINQVQKGARAVASGLKDTGKEVELASRQLKFIRFILGQLIHFRDSIEKDKDHGESLGEPRLVEIIEALQLLLADIESAFPQHGSGRVGIRKRLQWVLKEQASVAKLLTRLNFVLDLLNSILQLNLAYVLCKTARLSLTTS